MTKPFVLASMKVGNQGPGAFTAALAALFNNKRLLENSTYIGGV
jgi:hypothetical protein